MSNSPFPMGENPSQLGFTPACTSENADVNLWERNNQQSERHIQMNHEKRGTFLGDESCKSVSTSDSRISLNCADVKYNYSSNSNKDTIEDMKVNAPFNFKAGATPGQSTDNENEHTHVGTYVEDTTLESLQRNYMHSNDDTNEETNDDTNTDTNAEDSVGGSLEAHEQASPGKTPNHIPDGSNNTAIFSTLGRTFGEDAGNDNFPLTGALDMENCADYGVSYGTNYNMNCSMNSAANYGSNYATNNYANNYATNYATRYGTNYSVNCNTNYGSRFSPCVKNVPIHERGLLKTPPAGVYTFFRPNKKYEPLKYNNQIKKGVKKNGTINEKYHKAKNEYISSTGDVPLFKSANKYTSCNCAELHKSMHTGKEENVCIDIKQIHSDFIYLIVKYLYYERILPEANEVKRKISKYFPECAVLNTNFVNICREDTKQRFLISRINSHEEEDVEEEEDKRERAYFRKTFNNENICIYLRDISRDFFINPNDDTESVLQYIPLLFMHIIDRFRLQSSDNNHKGGRYILAETLKHTGPYIFRTMKLGRIIHILQKCIDLNILSYYNNNIIPIFTSMAISKTYVSKMLVNETPDSKNHKVNSITIIKDRIYRLLHSYSEDKTKGKGFSLSRLPLIYKNVYKESINIDQIGYSKLTEFINNELSDICFISTQHKFQCILMPLMENEQKHRDKNAKLKKEKQLKESLDYIKNYQWERCISYLHFANYARNKKTEPEVKRATPPDAIEQLINNSFLVKHKNYLDRTLKNGSDENVPLLLPLDVFNLPSSHDMYDTYHKSETYYSTNPTEDNSAIKCVDNMQSKCSILYDLRKCVSMDISIEESVNVNHMYQNYPSSYNVFHSLFKDTVEEIPIVDQQRMQI